MVSKKSRRKNSVDHRSGEVSAIEVTCGNCSHSFEESGAFSVTVSGPGVATYVCPDCYKRTMGPPPQLPIKRAAPVRAVSRRREGDKLVSAGLHFEGNVQLVFELGEGREIKQLVYDGAGNLIEECPASAYQSEPRTINEHLEEAEERLNRVTKVGLQRSWPELYGAFKDGDNDDE